MRLTLRGCLIFGSNFPDHTLDKQRCRPPASPHAHHSHLHCKQHKSLANEDSPEHPFHSAPNGRTHKQTTPHPLLPNTHETAARFFSLSTRISHQPSDANSHAQPGARLYSFLYSKTLRLPCRSQHTSKIVFPTARHTPH